jgi:hypothetical protein
MPGMPVDIKVWEIPIVVYLTFGFKFCTLYPVRIWMMSLFVMLETKYSQMVDGLFA